MEKFEEFGRQCCHRKTFILPEDESNYYEAVPTLPGQCKERENLLVHELSEIF